MAKIVEVEWRDGRDNWLNRNKLFDYVACRKVIEEGKTK
jgi:hypothetical protein